MFEKKTYDAWLATAELPYDLLIPLLHELSGSESIYAAWKAQENPLFKLIPPACRKKLNESADPEHMKCLQSLLCQNKIESMTILEETYPRCLRNISDPPGILFFQGNTNCLNAERKAAMVGSRTATYAGLKAAVKIASGLSRNGVTVVSGLAYGIDAESHRGCLEGGSPTIAVMGCGLDRVYPLQNTDLKEEILKNNGLLLSEYAPGSKPNGHHFPYRNRIISGLCDAVILIEAKIRSGSMTTIGHALKQGKEIFAYPGDPVSPMSEGNRLLLREGARFFTEAKEILEDMNWLDNISYVGQNSECSANSIPLDISEKAVYTALLKGALGFDELQQQTGMAPASLLSTLTVMQIKKMIDPLPGKRYQIRQ